MGRKKKNDVAVCSCMGEVFAESVSTIITEITSKEDEKSATWQLAEECYFSGFISAYAVKDEKGYILVSDAYRSYCEWAERHISKENFLKLIIGEKCSLIVVQQEDVFGVSVVLAINGFSKKNVDVRIFEVMKKINGYHN